MMNKVGAVSLGCSKNRVDTEVLLGHLKAQGFEIVSDVDEAEIIIVNTCGFITPAKEESINTILEMAQYRSGKCKLLAVCGCLSQRYMEELKAEMPEVDLFWGVKDQEGLARRIAHLAGKTPVSCAAHRLISTPPYSAYLRIADGCDNRCTYCAIPLIRGSRRSVPMEELVNEARRLAENGVSELTVIAQDTSAYGTDIYGTRKLSDLLLRLSGIDGIEWIRLLYTYPDTVDERLIDTIAGCDKITNYIDMPIQHIDPVMLERMNRHGTSEHIRSIMRYIRNTSPDFIIRSTVILGFPGETADQFSRLAEFLLEEPFDRLGAFAYSCEEGTPAAEMADQIPEEEKARRLDIIMRQQQAISLSLNRRRIGKTERVIIDGMDDSHIIGRGYGEAPEVDGSMHIIGKPGVHTAGEYINVRITGADEYDLWGEQL